MFSTLLYLSNKQKYRCNFNVTLNCCWSFGLNGTLFIISFDTEIEYNFCFHLDELKPSDFAAPEYYIKPFDTLTNIL